jgi:hypothetical protein
MVKRAMHPSRSKAIRIAGGSSPSMRRGGYDEGGAAGDDSGAGDGNPTYQPPAAASAGDAPMMKKGPEADQPFPYASSVPNWMGGTLVPTPPKIARSGGRARRK